MTEKQDYSQSELFTREMDSGQYKPRIASNPFFMRIRGYEKALLLIMGLVLVSIISFSLGVEKGKQAVLISNNNLQSPSYTI